MTDLDDIITTEPNNETSATSEETIYFSCKSFRNKKFIAIFIGIIFVIATIIFLLIFMLNKKKNSATIIITTTTELTPIEGSFHYINITNTTKWRQNGITIIQGDKAFFGSIYIDDDNTIYIPEYNNHRVMEWKYKETNGRIVAGGNEAGPGTHQLWRPINVILSKKTNSLIICDEGNRRVVHWSRQNATNGHVIIYSIDCHGLAIGTEGSLYVTNFRRHTVTRWKIEVNDGIIIASKYKEDDSFGPLYHPTYIFIDENDSIYVSNSGHHCIIQCIKNVTECGVNGGELANPGDNLNKFHYPSGIIVDHLGNVYVADRYNDRVVRWTEGATQGSVIVGGNGRGNESNQFYYPQHLAFDKYGNLYVVDQMNDRIQKFYVNLN